MKTPEEFDMTTNEGRLAYAEKHYPIGTIILSFSGDKFEISLPPKYFGEVGIKAECLCGSVPLIYHNNRGWVKIITKEEKKMETNLLELIRLFPELPTDYAKELVVEALKVKNGSIINLSKFINTVKSTSTTNYDIIPGNLPDNKADYVWRKIYDFKNNKMETQKLSRAGLKEIHSIACSNWKEILEKYGANNPLEDYIELTKPQVDTMFNSCTKEQLPIVSKYLKQDDGSINVTKFKCEIYNEDGCAIIEKRFDGEYAYKSLLLDDVYDWEIKTDNVGELCLIPTKKK